MKKRPKRKPTIIGPELSRGWEWLAPGLKFNRELASRMRMSLVLNPAWKDEPMWSVDGKNRDER